MNKREIKFYVSTIVMGLLCLFVLFVATGCGNQDMWDTNYTFHKAICEIGGERKEIEIKQWKDYDGSEQIQIIGKDGNTYLVSMNNCTLIKGE